MWQSQQFPSFFSSMRSSQKVLTTNKLKKSLEIILRSMLARKKNAFADLITTQLRLHLVSIRQLKSNSTRHKVPIQLHVSSTLLLGTRWHILRNKNPTIAPHPNIDKTTKLWKCYICFDWRGLLTISHPQISTIQVHTMSFPWNWECDLLVVKRKILYLQYAFK